MYEASVNVEVIVSPPMAVSENVALDEAMARSAASEGRAALRLWWATDPTVVIGRSEDPEVVANLEGCRSLGIEVIRRVSGGGTVLQMPGVLNYSLTASSPALFDIRRTFAVGAGYLVRVLSAFGVEAHQRGISDVAVGELKISGNAMAKRWGAVLLHGTLLCDLDLDLVESCLRHPPREPDYRKGRSHRDFVTTLRLLGIGATFDEVALTAADTARRMAADGELQLPGA
jgi:lipoate---protein ligase